MHTVFALLCFVVVIHWLIFPYPSGLLHWHCGNLTIAPVPAKQPWWIWINTSCEFIMNDCIITTKQSTTNPCAYFLGYTVGAVTTEVNERQWCFYLPYQQILYIPKQKQQIIICHMQIIMGNLIPYPWLLHIIGIVQHSPIIVLEWRINHISTFEGRGHKFDPGDSLW